MPVNGAYIENHSTNYVLGNNSLGVLDLPCVPRSVYEQRPIELQKEQERLREQQLAEEEARKELDRSGEGTLE